MKQHACKFCNVKVYTFQSSVRFSNWILLSQLNNYISLHVNLLEINQFDFECAYIYIIKYLLDNLVSFVKKLLKPDSPLDVYLKEMKKNNATNCKKKEFKSNLWKAMAFSCVRFACIFMVRFYDLHAVCLFTYIYVYMC